MFSSIDPTNQLASPSFLHIFGTDTLGRDLFYRCCEALVATCLPIFVITSCAALSGIFLGCVSLAYCPNLSKKLSYVTHAILFLPLNIFIFAVICLMQRAVFEDFLVAFGVLFCVRFFHQVRELHLRDQYLGYWSAHKMLGGSYFQRIYQYGLRGSWAKEIRSILFLDLQKVFIAEVSLSFLGIGVQEPQASFGNILALFPIFTGSLLHPVIILLFYTVTIMLPLHFLGSSFHFLRRERKLPFMPFWAKSS